MKPADLKIGTLYRLTQDVENPICDKRSANPMLKQPTFLKGTHFVCLCDVDFGGQVRLAHGRHRVTGGLFTADIRTKDGSRPSKNKRDASWAPAIVPHLEEVPLDSWNLLRRTFGSDNTGSVLRELVEDGTVPMERAIALLRKHTIGCYPFDS